MMMQNTLYTCVVLALLLCSGNAVKAEDADVDHTTESPVADMALVDTPHDMPAMEVTGDKPMSPKPDTAQPQTIADFIIHPLIALKPRVPEDMASEGKQATSSTTPSPWQLFGFNTGQGLGQGLGSSVSSLAGTVTGWLGNRIQLPGLVDTPVRESTTTTTTTTTTPKPDVVVRVQHRSTTRRPLIQINNNNQPNRFSGNNLNDSEEDSDDDEYDDDFNNGNRNRDHDDDDDEDDDDFEEEEDPQEDEEDDEEEEERPVRKQKPNQRRRRPVQGNNSNNKRRVNGNGNGNKNYQNQRRRYQNNQYSSDQGRRQPEDDHSEEVEDDDDDNEDQDFYYNGNSGSTKRSQSQQNFIQRGQQSLINQIRQLTRGQTPAEVGSTIRKNKPSSNNKKRRQQATLIINRNGQTIYLAPELTESNSVSQFPFYATSTSSANKRPVVGYPQPPLTVPLKRKGKPTQYISIPWTQLGISTPNQIVSVADGIQSQPLILSIPPSALEAMQNPKPGKRRPILTSDAVPLLADASLMDVFKPPQIPPARTPTISKGPIKTPVTNVTPVLIATKTQQRVRPGTIVEMAPAVDGSTEQSASSEGIEGSQYIIVGEDNEPGLTRQAFPILGESRQSIAFSPYFNLLHAGQYRNRNSRQLSESELETPMGEQMVMESEDEKKQDSTINAAVMQSTDTAEEPTKEVPVATEAQAIDEPAPVVENNKPVEEPLVEVPVVQSGEQVIPVQVITSDTHETEVSKVDTKVAETKSE